MTAPKDEQAEAFTLEDIIKEFGSAAQDPAELDTAAASQPTDEEAVDSISPAQPEPAEPAEPVEEPSPAPTPEAPAKKPAKPEAPAPRPTRRQAAAMSAAEMGLIDDAELDAIIEEFGSKRPPRYSEQERLATLEQNLRSDLGSTPSMDFFEQQFGGYTDPTAQPIAPDAPAVTDSFFTSESASESLTEPAPEPEAAPVDRPEDPDEIPAEKPKRRRGLSWLFGALDEEEEEDDDPGAAEAAPQPENPAAVKAPEDPAALDAQPMEEAEPAEAPEENPAPRRRRRATVPFQTSRLPQADAVQAASDATELPENLEDELECEDAAADDAPLHLPFLGKKKAPPAPEPTLTAHEGCQRYAKRLRHSDLWVKLAGALACLALFFSAYYSLDWNFIAPLSQITSIAWCVNVLLVLSALVCRDVIRTAIASAKRKQFDLNFLTSLASLVALVDGVIAARHRVGYGATACILLFLAQWSLQLQRQGMFRTLRVLDKNEITTGIVRSENVFHNKAALFVADCTPEEFMAHVEKPSLSAQVLQIYTPLAILLTLILAIAAQAKHAAQFLQCWAPMLLAAVPAVGLLCYSRAFATLARRLAKRGAALCGWYGACAIGNRAAVLLHDDDLFPPKACEPNGVKSYNGYTGNQVIGYAQAVLQKAGSGLAACLDALLTQEGGRRMQADAIRLYESSGIGGKFGMDTVLVGTLSFMRRMGVHMSAETKVKRATYVSVNGELAGLIAIRYSTSAQVRDAIGILTRSGRTKPVLATCNVTITPKLLAQKFRIPADRFLFPDLRQRAELAARTADPESTLCAVLAKPHIAAFADAAVGGRILQTVVKAGLLMAIISGLIGICVLGALSLTGAIAALSASYLVLFDLIWLVPALLLTGWTRSY